MDSNWVSYLALAVSGASVVLGYINHKKIVSRCCGHVVEASLDVSDSSPRRRMSIIPISVPPLAK